MRGRAMVYIYDVLPGTGDLNHDATNTEMI